MKLLPSKMPRPGTSKRRRTPSRTETKRRYSYDEMLAAFNAGVENNVAFPDIFEDLLKRRKS